MKKPLNAEIVIEKGGWVLEPEFTWTMYCDGSVCMSTSRWYKRRSSARRAARRVAYKVGITITKERNG